MHEEMEEVCALCNVYVGEGTAKAKRLRLFGDNAVDTREQMDMFLYQELVENVWPYIKDFPYPVGNDPKTPWPSSLTIHSFCFSFNSVTPAFLIANSIAPSIFRTESVSYEFY